MSDDDCFDKWQSNCTSKIKMFLNQYDFTLLYNPEVEFLSEKLVGGEHGVWVLLIS